MFTRSMKSGSILLAAGVLALSTAACSSSGSKPAASSTSSASVSATGAAGSSPASQSSASSSSATSTSASASASTSDSGASASDSASSSSGSGAPAITNKTSDWVERNGFKIKVDSVTYPYVPAAGQGTPPGPNESLLKLRIEVVNTGKGSASFTPGDADIRDSGNRGFTFDIVGSDELPKDVHFDLRSLKPGEKQVGEAIFAGPSGAKGLRLVFLSQLMARDGSGVATDPKPVVDLGV